MPLQIYSIDDPIRQDHKTLKNDYTMVQLAENIYSHIARQGNPTNSCLEALPCGAALQATTSDSQNSKSQFTAMASAKEINFIRVFPSTGRTSAKPAHTVLLV